ncbi:hypothetical protein, partial [Burkholderia cepacia]|uniref:hypothetical protein n=1 Tax=Burkholderia cepacia TaxID=292 RepID=UPI001C614673
RERPLSSAFQTPVRIMRFTPNLCPKKPEPPHSYARPSATNDSPFGVLNLPLTSILRNVGFHFFRPTS